MQGGDFWLSRFNCSAGSWKEIASHAEEAPGVVEFNADSASTPIRKLTLRYYVQPSTGLGQLGITVEKGHDFLRSRIELTCLRIEYFIEITANELVVFSEHKANARRFRGL